MYVIRHADYSKPTQPDAVYLDLRKVNTDHIPRKTTYKIVNTNKLFKQVIKVGIEINDTFSIEGYSGVVAANFGLIRDGYDHEEGLTIAETMYRGLDNPMCVFDITNTVSLKGQKNILKLTFLARALNDKLGYECWKGLTEDPEKWGVKCLYNHNTI